MLKIFNNFALFFEDCYKQVAVREYARLMKFTPPTASKILKEYHKNGWLSMRQERKHLLFSLNHENKEIVDISRMYWKRKLDILVKTLQKKLVQPAVIAFGSVAKAEVTPQSDVDIAIFGEKKPLDIGHVEKILGRRISVYWFSSLRQVKNEHLLNNILNGIPLYGRLKW